MLKHTHREIEAAHRLGEALLAFATVVADAQAARDRAADAEARSRERASRPGGFGCQRPAFRDAEGSPDRLLLSAREAAEALQISPRTLWGMTAPRGPLPSVRIGSAVRYPVKDLERALERLKSTTPNEGDATP